MLPTVTRDWVYRADQILVPGANALASCRALLFQIVQSLTGALSSGWIHRDKSAAPAPAVWTVAGSALSSSVTTTVDGVNRWTTADSIVWGTSNFSWIVLRCSALGIWLMLSCKSSLSYNLTASISHVGFGAAAGGANGSSTAAPTAPDEISLLAATTWGGPAGTSYGSVLHVAIGDDGESTRLFINRNGATLGAWIFERVSGAPASWLTPNYCHVRGYEGNIESAGVLGSSGLLAGSYARGRAGPNTFNLALVTEAIANASSSDLPSLTTGVNVFTSRWPLYPMGVAINGSTPGIVGRARIGRLADLWYVANTRRVTGDSYDDADGVRRFTTFYSVAMPWPDQALRSDAEDAPTNLIYPAELAADILDSIPTPPVVANFVAPAHRRDFASFDVFDPDGLRAIVCLIGYGSDLPSEVVHLDTGARTGFCGPYFGARTPIDGGYHYEVARTNGWPLGAARFHALAIDVGGALG